jgi:hypothetical protein
MESVIVTLVVLAVAYWIYRAGKREGSTKGYGVGRRHERQKRFRR